MNEGLCAVLLFFLEEGVVESMLSRRSETFSLLVVDDDTTSMLLIRETLINCGYQVETVPDGHQALAYAEASQPDLILLDVLMPGMDGLETCRRLKANPRTETIPVLFVTSLGNTKDIVRGFEAGGTDYIVKPFNALEIIARIKIQLKVVTLTRQLRNTRDLQEQDVLRRTVELEKANRELQASHALLQQFEKENERRRHFLELVLLEVPDAIVTLDDQCLIVDWNPGAVRMFGYQPEEARGQHLDCLVAEGVSFKEAEAKTKKMFSGQALEPFETKRRHRDGSVIHVIAAGSPIIMEGVLTGAVAVYTDISAIKATAEELRRSHELFLTVLESIDAIIYVVDEDSYEILFMNQRMQHNCGGNLAGGICWRDFYGQKGPCPTCLAAQESDSRDNLCEGCVWEDFNIETGRWYRNHHRKIKWVDGRLVRLHMGTDISDQKRIEQERKDYEKRIQQLQKMEAIGTLAGGIAHDFNNILSAVFGYTELAILQAGGVPLMQRNLNGILEAAKRAKELVQQILLFSRQGEQELKPLQLRPLIKETLKMLRSSLPTTIRIDVAIDGIFENVLANPTQIHQILMNLCANAAHAMEDDGGVLTITLDQVELSEETVRRHPGRNPGTYMRLRVQDTGRGIATDMIDKIFNPYFTTKAKGQGTGLGLSVVHGIIQNYFGIIEVRSQLGRGTVFDIFLPAIHHNEVREELSVPQLPLGKEHILLVDDEFALTEVLSNMLRLLGYRVTATQSSFKALRFFAEDPSGFDLLITDMTMPELTGDRLTTELRNIRPDIPVIICTGYNRRLSDNKPENLTVQAILMKPVEQLELARTVRDVLDNHTLPANNG